jgi:hypothetical protein
MRPLLLLLACALSLLGQAQMERQKRPLYFESAYQPKGWFFAPGLTYMLPNPHAANDTRLTSTSDGGDTLYSGQFDARGKFGFYAEAGRHHFSNKIFLIDHFDYGIHYKLFRGGETFDGLIRTDSLRSFSNSGNFSRHYAGAFFNASNILRLGEYTWLHNSLGANVDYAFIQRNVYNGPTTGMDQQFQRNLLAQLHYKIGFGWKAGPGLYFLPSLETPILNAYTFDQGRSTLAFFSSRYRPILFSIRILFLDKTKGRSCENQPNAKTEDISKEKAGKHAPNTLFGPDVKSKKVRRR